MTDLKQEFGTSSPEQEHLEDGEDQQNRENGDRILKVDLSHIRNSNLNESASQQQRTDFLEELNNREDEIRRMLYESQPGTDRASLASKGTKKGVTTEFVRHIQNEDDEECTFKPKLNAKTKKLINDKRQAGEQPAAENLYKVAQDKKTKNKEQEAELKQNVNKAANSNKISANSMKIILKKIEASLRNLISDVENPNSRGRISFENLGVILHRLGIFQNLEFIQQNDENTNKSSLSVNQSKIKPQRLAREIAFHENFWRILDETSDDENLVPSETVFRFLMVLVEDKATIPESSSFLEEIVEVALEEKGLQQEGEASLYEKVKTEKGLWEMEKLVVEFRKLFNDKTSFMNIYSNTGVLSNKETLEERQTQEGFRPQINPKSKEIINKKQRETYEDKVKAAVQEHVSPTKLQTRYDVLHEHHKYIKTKKHENLEQKIEQEMANCTFKPTITEYKKPAKSGNQTNANASINLSELRYSQLINQDLSKAKRHDLLYEVARVQKEKQQQKAYEIRRQEEEEELAKCTFKPKITPLSEESPTKFQTYQNSGAPKGYKKAIERLQVSNRIKEEKKAEREHIPRGENYEKLRNSEFKPPSFLSRPKTKKQEALVYVDVNIGPGKTGRIGIHKGDNAKILARNFAKTYSLPPIMKDSLEKLLQSYIDSYFPETEHSPDDNEGQYNDQEVHYQVDFNDEHAEEEEEEENEEDHRGHEQQRQRVQAEEEEEEEDHEEHQEREHDEEEEDGEEEQ